VVRAASVLASVLFASVVFGCGTEVDRADYVQANEAIFERLPGFPDARLAGQSSTAYRSSESGPIVGYGTLFELELPSGATASDVSAFFHRRLRPRWKLIEALEGPVLNFRMNHAAVSINLENAPVHILEIAVDHAFYGKAGP
jgi:hypothetical protein